MAYAYFNINQQIPAQHPDPVLLDKIESIMKEAYNNKSYNSYDTWPGTALADHTANPHQRLALCIKNVPYDFTEVQLNRIICNYGVVTNLHKSKTPSCSYYFAVAATENDFEAILKGMEYNEFGIKVEPKTSKKEYNNSLQLNLPQHNSTASNSTKESLARTSQNQANKPHPELEIQNLSNLLRNNCTAVFNQRDHIQNRVLNNILTNEDLIRAKCKESQGIYDQEKGLYVKACSQLLGVKLGVCKVCKNASSRICERCHDIYCSVQCQTKDWPHHKLFCFKMPNLRDVDVENRRILVNTIEPEKNQDIQVNTHEQNNPNYNKDNQQNVDIQTKFISHRCESASNTNNSVKEDKNNELHKALVADAKVFNNSDKAATPQSGQIVVMTFVEQTNMVFVRSHEKEDHENYLQTISLVEKSALKSKILTTLPKVGEYVLAHDGNAWFRAVIINNDIIENIYIMYVDFGNCEYKKLNELRELLPECFNLMCYIVPIYLKNLENCLPNENFNEYMNGLVNSFTQLKLTYNPSDVMQDKVVAELWNIETNENLNNKCLELLRPVPPNDNEEPIFFDDLPKESLPSGENIPVFFLDGLLIDAGIITCIPVGAVRELNQLNIELKEYAQKSTEVYTPRENEICVAKYSEDPEVWYRAACYEVSGNGFPVLFFIDYGNTCPVAIANIRKYPKAFTLPCKTNECQISGLEHLIKHNANEKLEAKLRELLPLYTEVVLSKVENIDGEYDLIYLPEVIQAITDAGLI